MTLVFSLGTRLRVRMRTTFENGVLRNGQQPGSAVNSFIDLGEFGAMKARVLIVWYSHVVQALGNLGPRKL